MSWFYTRHGSEAIGNYGASMGDIISKYGQAIEEILTLHYFNRPMPKTHQTVERQAPD
jgi:hypothetical protein